MLFTKARRIRLRVTPPGGRSERGVFATRSPHRPNAIGILTVQLLRREGTTLFVRGVDVLDGTQMLDIKPYFAISIAGRRPAPGGWRKSGKVRSPGRICKGV
jgi:tRNA-Thr(GGU) m(6)t(6)A37 methyltransferase TsaA